MGRVLYQSSGKYQVLSWGTVRYKFNFTGKDRDSLVLNNMDKGLMFVSGW